MGQLAEAYLTPEEYLLTERQAETKHEYYDGEIFAMAGASQRHNFLTVGLSAQLYFKLRGKPCDLYSNDMRVRVRDTGLYTYPDLVIACGGSEFDDAQKDTLTNPGVLFEILSDSTESYDRGRKFAHYRQIPTLTDYLLVAQNEPCIEHYRRQDDGWLLTEARGKEGVISLDTLDCTLPLAEVYEKIDF